MGASKVVGIHSLMHSVAEDTGLPLDIINKVVRSLLVHIRFALVNAGTVKLMGLGRLTVRKHPSTNGKNLLVNRWTKRKKTTAGATHQYKVYFAKSVALNTLLKRELGGRNARR